MGETDVELFSSSYFHQLLIYVAVHIDKGLHSSEHIL